MAYLTQQELTTHIYAEKITEIIRNYVVAYANLASFPATGITGRKYRATDTSKLYVWNGAAYEEITDFDIAAEAIDCATAEVKAYLSRFDLPKLFDPLATGFVNDKNLKSKVKDVACWHLIKLANPNIDVAMFRTAYEDARDKFFAKVQSGDLDPEGWPYKADDPGTDFPEGNAIVFSTETKRNNHF